MHNEPTGELPWETEMQETTYQLGILPCGASEWEASLTEGQV